MTMLQGLLVAIDVAQRKRDDAGLAMARVQRQHDNALHQMDQLQSYAADTESRWSGPAQGNSTPQLMAHYYQFMDRLQQTIGLQQGVIADVQRQCQGAKQLLLEADVRVAGLILLLDKQRAALARAQAQREQKETDEFAARRLHRSPSDQEIREHP